MRAEHVDEDERVRPLAHLAYVDVHQRSHEGAEQRHEHGEGARARARGRVRVVVRARAEEHRRPRHEDDAEEG